MSKYVEIREQKYYAFYFNYILLDEKLLSKLESNTVFVEKNKLELQNMTMDMLQYILPMNLQLAIASNYT
ncbi:13588_t:CDS:2 [Cetraspora pellucida]|uniref:13588_t:CDS:1 n=1 Tax=Cetraspora pellucida TaxID=1433469 RepID=A0A9N9G1Z6_9GLOM|nr:13588_t:CDS:2 [Cetraspora pellucida]